VSGWRVSFHDRDDSRAPFRELTFADPDKIYQLVARTPTKLMLEDRHASQMGIRSGLGAVNVTLDDEQYRKLLR
jgi:hypothetical protein